MLLADAVMDAGEIKWNQEQWKVLCSGNGPRERFAASNMWQIDICADDFPEGEPNPDIIVYKWSVSNENTGGDGSGLGDVGNEVIADDDVA